jgi:hypothetical protein
VPRLTHYLLSVSWSALDESRTGLLASLARSADHPVSDLSRHGQITNPGRPMIDMSPETVATVLTLLVILSLAGMVGAARLF